MEEKIVKIKCPNCGKEIDQTLSGDLDSGWSGVKPFEGTYTEGVITYSWECPFCGEADGDVIIHD